MSFSASGIMVSDWNACRNNFVTSASMTVPSYSYQDYDYMESAYKQEKPKEKHFCKYCHTNSEKTNSYGNCISCGAPFGEDTPNCAWGVIDSKPTEKILDRESMQDVMNRIEEEAKYIKSDSPDYGLLFDGFKKFINSIKR